MSGIRLAAVVIWVLFWAGWLGAAFTAKQTVSHGRGWQGRIGIWIMLVLIFRVLRPHGLEIHSVGVAVAGLLVLLSGLGFAVWARVYLGRNWGMPTSMRAEPELVTSGPYRWVRHPIYTGLTVGIIGTALVFNLLALVVAVAVLALFYYSATIEERNMTEAFPKQYPAYRARTKMLIPFML